MIVIYAIWIFCGAGIIGCIAWGRARRQNERSKAEREKQEERERISRSIEKKRAQEAARREARAQRAEDAARRAEEAERRKAEKHAAAMQRAEERHAQRMRHAQEYAAVRPQKAAKDGQEEEKERQIDAAQEDAKNAKQADAITPEAFAAQHAIQTTRKASGAFAGQTVAFTGRLYGMPRAEAIKAVQDRGGRAFTGMPAGTTLLVVGTLKGDGNSRKLEKADEWIGQVRKITEEQFLQMLEA